MANDSFSQQALANDPSFAGRVRSQLVAQAFAVLAETPVVPTRVTYANQVLANLDREVRRWTPVIVMRTNLLAFPTSYNFDTGRVVTAAGDADILSQISTDFNTFAGLV